MNIASRKSKVPRTIAEAGLMRPRTHLYLESRIDEDLGVLPGEVRKVKNVMSSALTVVSPDTSLEDAVSLMTAMNVPVIVAYEGTRLVGMITDRDVALTRRSRENLQISTVGDVMRDHIPYCHEDDLLTDAQALMRVSEVDWMPVLDRTGRLAGVLSIYIPPS
ncbi:MAG: CBS domain-containing protein [Nitrospira sp.]|nr:CBS domain-containing protein [Nitrospira sp.]